MPHRSFLAVLVAILSLAGFAGPAVAAAPGFCAYNSAIQTGWVSGFYSRVYFDTIKADTSLRYAAAESTWEPVFPGEQPEWVDFIGQIQINTGIATNGYEVIVAKLVKNNQIDVQTGETVQLGDGQGTAVVQFNVRDLAQPGDAYWLILYISNARGLVQLDNHPAHTFWCGIVIK